MTGFRATRWHAVANQMDAFIALTGRFPSACGDTVEQVLRSWLYQQRSDATHERPRFTAARRSRLDQIHPHWQMGNPPGHLLDNELWQVNAAATCAFLEARGSWPNMDAIDPTEQALGRWLTKQRRDAKSGATTSTPARRAYLDVLAPGWNKTKDDHWADSAAALAAFHDANGHWPRASASPRSEAVLSRWMHRQRTSATAERAARLDVVAPGWRTSDR